MNGVIKGIIVFIVIIALPAIAGSVENKYTIEGRVIAVEDQTVVVKDYKDNIWTFDGEGFQVENTVWMLMDSNHTPNNIYDDKIIDAKVVYEK